MHLLFRAADPCLPRPVAGARFRDQADLQAFIRGLKIPDDAKALLLEMTPSSYLGKAVELTERLKK